MEPSPPRRLSFSSSVSLSSGGVSSSGSDESVTGVGEHVKHSSPSLTILDSTLEIGRQLQDLRLLALSCYKDRHRDAIDKVSDDRNIVQHCAHIELQVCPHPESPFAGKLNTTSENLMKKCNVPQVTPIDEGEFQRAPTCGISPSDDAKVTKSSMHNIAVVSFYELILYAAPTT